VAGSEVAVGSVVGAGSDRTEGQSDADATPAPAVTPVLGLGLAGARNGDGADGERGDESGSELGLHGGFPLSFAWGPCWPGMLGSRGGPARGSKNFYANPLPRSGTRGAG